MVLYTLWSWHVCFCWGLHWTVSPHAGRIPSEVPEVGRSEKSNLTEKLDPDKLRNHCSKEGKCLGIIFNFHLACTFVSIQGVNSSYLTHRKVWLRYHQIRKGSLGTSRRCTSHCEEKREEFQKRTDLTLGNCSFDSHMKEISSRLQDAMWTCKIAIRALKTFSLRLKYKRSNLINQSRNKGLWLHRDS